MERDLQKNKWMAQDISQNMLIQILCIGRFVHVHLVLNVYLKTYNEIRIFSLKYSLPLKNVAILYFLS